MSESENSMAYTYNLYPEQLRRIADMCEAMNKIDGIDVPEHGGVTIGFQQNIKVVDEHGDLFGHLSDEIGGAWAFTPYVRLARGEKHPHAETLLTGGI